MSVNVSKPYLVERFNKKAVVVISWWLDSTVLLYKIISEWYEPYAISFNYGQKHSKELECAKKTCEYLWVNHKIVDISFLKDLLDSSLLNDDEEVPEGDYREETMKSTVVPSRNLIFSSIAIGYWQSIGADVVALWVHNGDHTIYPDCRTEFVEKLNEVAKISDWHKIELYCPFVDISKSDIVKIWKELDVDFSLTWSCYKWWEKPCGKCWTCVERLEAFHDNWLEDVLDYEQD